jgi:hypothetical protein
MAVAPGVARSLWNEGPEDVVMVIVSTRIDNVRARIKKLGDLWAPLVSERKRFPLESYLK